MYDVGLVSRGMDIAKASFLELRRGNASVGMLQEELSIVNIPSCMMGSEFFGCSFITSQSFDAACVPLASTGLTRCKPRCG